MAGNILYLFATISLCAVSADAQSLLVAPVDGEPFQSRLVSADGNGKLVFEAAGKTRILAVADLLSYGQPAELRKGPIVLLADGGYLPAVLLSAGKSDLSLESAGLGGLNLPLDSLAGIVFRPPPRAAELDALLDRVAHADGAMDRLVLDNGDELTGLIDAVSLTSEKLRIKGNLGAREVPIRRIVALVFNPLLRRQPAVPAGACWIGLNDGTRVAALRAQLDGDSLQWSTLSGATRKASAKDLVFYMPQSGRAVFLSDIRPEEYRFLPYLEMQWPFKTDRNVTGGQLRCGGRLFLKGIGVHSAARLSYRLDPPWGRFQAEVGIDDSTGGRGSVGFRVFVDGKQKYASPPIRGGTPPQAVSVDLAGGKQLDLVVDYGEAGDVLDHADWLNARLVK